MTFKTKLSIIIPVLHLSRPKNLKRVFMPRQTIVELLEDIRRNVRTEHEVIVVCNGTDDELRRFVVGEGGIDRYCLNSVNVGVARAWNIGAQLAEGDVLCYLNDDVSVGPGALEGFATMLREDRGLGQVGPAGSYWRDCAHARFVAGAEPVDADVISGFCFLLRSETFHQLGGFDVGFTPAGFEEIDFSFRVRQAGYRCRVDPRADIKHYHHHGVSAHRTDIQYLGSSVDTVTLHARNSAYFRAKWAGVFP